MKFEEKMEKLEEITEKLESGDVGLDEAMQLYSEGAAIAKELCAILEEAEKKVTLLTSEGGEQNG